MAYRIYTRVNFADTSRDKDNVHIKELCYKSSREKAIKYMYDYIKKHFTNRNTGLCGSKTALSATDACSYGETIMAEKITID
jgi:hypothetical protein